MLIYVSEILNKGFGKENRIQSLPKGSQWRGRALLSVTSLNFASGLDLLQTKTLVVSDL
jgi:hypothetical protein